MTLLIYIILGVVGFVFLVKWLFTKPVKPHYSVVKTWNGEHDIFNVYVVNAHGRERLSKSGLNTIEEAKELIKRTKEAHEILETNSYKKSISEEVYTEDV